MAYRSEHFHIDMRVTNHEAWERTDMWIFEQSSPLSPIVDLWPPSSHGPHRIPPA
jgi:hypothetical protein